MNYPIDQGVVRPPRKRRGRYNDYPFQHMAVGDSFCVPAPEPDRPLAKILNNTLQQYMSAYPRVPYQFSLLWLPGGAIEGHPVSGYRIWRMA